VVLTFKNCTILGPRSGVSYSGVFGDEPLLASFTDL
jgi:hypothetical protein